MSPTAYYNENHPFAAEMLRTLIAEGELPYGHVDERSIVDVTPGDLDGFDQAHFFAGCGGWPLALRLAGVPDWFPVWTGSPPCQPFSQANKRPRAQDERHLWPVWSHLIGSLAPPLVFGEQVRNAITHGWLDVVRRDLEAEGYAFGWMVLGAHSAGAPHIRQRIYFVADADVVPGQRYAGQVFGEEAGTAGQGDVHRREPDRHPTGCAHCQGAVADADGERTDGYADEDEGARRKPRAELLDVRQDGFWSRRDYLPFEDGKYRPVEPGTFPLVDGLPAGVGPGGDPSATGNLSSTSEARPQRVRAYGNAIVPQVAALFVRQYLEDTNA